MKPLFQFALRSDLKDNKEFLPKRATKGSAGWDVRCAQEDRRPILIRPGKYVKIPLGIRAICPEDWWLEMKPRSSTFAKKALHCLYGTIDADFRGEMLFCAQYIPDISSLGTDLILEFGDAIGQMIPRKMEEMIIQEISSEDFETYCKSENNARGTGGFGSTGR